MEPLLIGLMSVMRMRQSISQLERAFVEEIELDRARRENLRHTAAKRSRSRRVQRKQQRSSLRFFLLVLSLIATAVLVTVAMFQTLYYMMG
jgi:Mg2+/citrate symporter